MQTLACVVQRLRELARFRVCSFADVRLDLLEDAPSLLLGVLRNVTRLLFRGIGDIRRLLTSRLRGFLRAITDGRLPLFHLVTSAPVETSSRTRREDAQTRF